jgi:predicted GNAT family acetyltransferase
MASTDDTLVTETLAVAQIPAALRLSAQAGWNQTGEDWRMLIDLAPEGCLAMEVDGELAATTTLLSYGRRLAWIGMVLTKLQYRGRGFARRLLTQALAQADQMGIETVKLDATDQGKPIYENLVSARNKRSNAGRVRAQSMHRSYFLTRVHRRNVVVQTYRHLERTARNCWRGLRAAIRRSQSCAHTCSHGPGGRPHTWGRACAIRPKPLEF